MPKCFVLFILIVIFVLISADNTIQLCHVPLKEVLYTFLMILPSISQLNECKVLLFGCNGTIFTYLHSTCYISLPKAILLLCFRKRNFLNFSKTLISKLSLNVLVKSQSSFTFIKVSNYDRFNLHHILLIRSGDAELNPGPKKISSLTFFHWNVNGILTHAFDIFNIFYTVLCTVL